MQNHNGGADTAYIKRMRENIAEKQREEKQEKEDNAVWEINAKSILWAFAFICLLCALFLFGQWLDAEIIRPRLGPM